MLSERFLFFAAGVGTAFLITSLYIIYKENKINIPVSPVLRRIVFSVLSVIAVHSLILYNVFEVIPKHYDVWTSQSGCFLWGMALTAVPVGIIRQIVPKSGKVFSDRAPTKFLKIVFNLLHLLQDVYYLSIASEIQRLIRIRTWQLVESETHNSYRAINKLFEQGKLPIALEFRDYVYDDPEKAFDIFRVTNIYMKNHFLLAYYHYKPYLSLLQVVKSDEPIRFQSWDCIERRTDQRQGAYPQERRYYNRPGFRHGFLEGTLGAPIYHHEA